ncbi:restriction endonuclease subunit S, partial [Candidatus Halobeggiatoa sp. HSG11]|nr:restriction endonuclease subunit S [Candidatus Halobeggiatoa sp. HSG11]
MTEKNKIPEIRFKGFGGEWLKNKVGKLCDYIVPGRNKPRIFNGDIPWITTPDITNNGNIEKSKIGLAISREEAQNVGAKIVPKDSIVMSCVGELGIVAKVNNELIINQQLHAFIPKEKLNNWFLLYELSVRKRYMEKTATKTAVPYMNKDNCNSIPIIFPTIPEQTKIGNFFQQLDSLITQHQRKYDKLLNVKKAMLEKMFPKQGAAVGLNCESQDKRPEIPKGIWLNFYAKRCVKISSRPNAPAIMP